MTKREVCSFCQKKDYDIDVHAVFETVFVQNGEKSVTMAKTGFGQI